MRLGPLFPPAASHLRRRVLRCRRIPAAPPSAEPHRPPAEKTDLHIQRMLDPGQFHGKEVKNGLETTGQDNSQPLKDSRWPARCYSRNNALWAQNSTPLPVPLTPATRSDVAPTHPCCVCHKQVSEAAASPCPIATGSSGPLSSPCCSPDP